MLIYNKKQENDRVHQFLLGLNEEFMITRSQILSLGILTSLSKVFCLIAQEEKTKDEFQGKR